MNAANARAASLTLAWDPPNDGVTAGYVIVYGTAPGNYTSQIDTGAVTQFVVNGLANGTQYCFAVRAYSANGALSDLSTEVCGTTSGQPPSGGSTGGSTGGDEGGSTGGATGGSPGGFTGGGAAGGSGGGSGGGSSTPAAPGTSPSTRQNPSRGSSRATVDSSVAGGAPQWIGATMVGPTAHLSWMPPADGLGASAYRVEVGTAPGTANVTTAIVPVPSLVLQNLADGSYYVRAHAMRGGAAGDVSRELAVTVRGGALLCSTPPPPPVGFAASALGSLVTLSWQPSTGDAATSYLLHVGSAPGLQDLMVLPLGAATSLSATAGDGVYALRLFAQNPCGTSAGTDTMLGVGAAAAALLGNPGSGGGQPGAIPGAPEQVVGEVVGNTVSVTWSTPVTGGTPTRYIIEAETAGGPVALDTGNPATAFAHPNTPPGQYVIRVRAGNAAGVGPASAAVTVVVP